MTKVENIKQSFFSKHVGNKALLPLWIILLVSIALDFTTRVNVTATDSNSEFTLQNLNNILGVSLSDKEAQELLVKINKFDNIQQSPDSKNIKNKGLSLEQQLAQEGDISELHAENMRYRLIGIFEQTSRFAVILEQNLATNEQKLLRVNALENLKSYQISSILSDRVIVTGNNKQINLFLYKTSNK